MIETDLKNNELNLKKKILRLNEEVIAELFNDLDITLPEVDVSKENLSELLIQSMKAKDKVGNLEVVLKYREFYPIIESFSKDFLIEVLPKKLRNNVTSKSNKEEVLIYLKQAIIEGFINSEYLERKIKIYSVASKVKKVTKKDELAYLTKYLWDDMEENIDKEKIIQRITTELEYGNYPPDRVEGILDQMKKGQRKSKSENINGLAEEIRTLESRFLSIEKLLKKQEQQIVETNKLISEMRNFFVLNNNQMKSDLENKFNLNNTEKLIFALRKESLNLKSLNQESFGSIVENLNQENILDIDLLRDGLAIVIVDYLMKLTKEMDWKISLDLFYKVLSEEVSEIKGSISTIVEIPKVREKVCRRMGIATEKFDSLLLKCFDVQWVNLEVGTPIGETDIAWLDTGKNRFYYMKLLRK
ncbi:hypothetical protein [Methanosarcina sp. 1.H.A.2.2]|uniref:hypothetical protein n=1 Tax=Methanosarcina sp. 1.H.A.2.2 TaxID=1483601 RepID=UPI0006227C6F|nr:hypothetical protein [Methanosarcina sp. 1.H.A.2.2]KKH45438.1 hypothetical protein EO93_18590 [Methanosarcina sp. 1.H.A.2.2]